MKVIFYVAATCGNIDFHFIANLEHQFCNHFLADYTVFAPLYLLHERAATAAQGGGGGGGGVKEINK